jgi:hypothetical protein
LYESHDLSEFVVPPDATLPEVRVTMLALVQRGSIMARKGIWDLASADFRDAAEIARKGGYETLEPQELTALRKVFQPGARSIFDNNKDATAFARSIAAFSRPLRLSITANLLFPVTYRLRRVLKHDNKAFEARQLWRIVSSLFQLRSVRPLLEARRHNLDHFKVSVLDVETSK